MSRAPADHIPPRRLRIGLALKRARVTAGKSQEQAAAEAEVSQQTWSKTERGEQDTDLDKMERMAAAVGVGLEDLVGDMAGPSQPPLPGRRASQLAEGAPGWPMAQSMIQQPTLPIRDRAQAGAWLAADDDAQMPIGSYPIGKDPRYAYADQWVTQVVGDSLNKLYVFDGDYVHCVSIPNIGYSPQTGDIVEIERIRFGGQLRELSLKQVEVTPGGVLLWPRSTNPRYQEPIDLRHGAGEGEEIEVRLRGLVRAVIRRI
jgi:transcriptional regulator with XRE-family HTH domain